MNDPDHTKSPESVKLSDFRTLLKEFNKRGVFVPRTFIDFTGDTQAASFLSQVLYWSDRTDDSDGWFFKTYEEWKTEIGLSRFQITRCAAKLKALGLEKKVKKSGKTPKAHYRINHDVFEPAYRQFLESQETGKSRNLQVQSSSEVQDSRLSSFSTFNVRETNTSSYIDYIQESTEDSKYNSLRAENEELRKQVSDLKAEMQNLTKQIEQLLEQLSGKSESQTKKKSSAKRKEPAKPRPPDEIFDAIAVLYVKPGDPVNGAAGWIGKVKSLFLEVKPDLTGTETQNYIQDWRKINRYASNVRDEKKIKLDFQMWLNRHQSQLTREEDSDNARYERFLAQKAAKNGTTNSTVHQSGGENRILAFPEVGGTSSSPDKQPDVSDVREHGSRDPGRSG